MSRVVKIIFASLLIFIGFAATSGCTPGEVKCEDYTLEVCNEWGLWIKREVCALASDKITVGEFDWYGLGKENLAFQAYSVPWNPWDESLLLPDGYLGATCGDNFGGDKYASDGYSYANKPVILKSDTKGTNDVTVYVRETACSTDNGDCWMGACISWPPQFSDGILDECVYSNANVATNDICGLETEAAVVIHEYREGVPKRDTDIKLYSSSTVDGDMCYSCAGNPFMWYDTAWDILPLKESGLTYVNDDRNDEDLTEYHTCGVQTNELAILTSKKFENLEKLDRAFYADSWITETVDVTAISNGYGTALIGNGTGGYYFTYNNIICGSVFWKNYCGGIVEPYCTSDSGDWDNYFFDYGGWLVDMSNDWGDEFVFGQKSGSLLYYMPSDLTVDRRGFMWNTGREATVVNISCEPTNYLGLEITPPNKFLMLPLIQPACFDSRVVDGSPKDYSFDAYAAGAYLVCSDRNCWGKKANGWNNSEGNVLLNYRHLLTSGDEKENEGKCPQTDGWNYLFGSWWTEDEQNLMSTEYISVEDEIFSMCFYDEKVGEEYYAPLFTKQVKEGDKLLCECDWSTVRSGDGSFGPEGATEFPKGCRYDDDSNEGDAWTCANEEQGILATDVECSSTGWISNYTEAKMESIYLANQFGFKTGYYDCTKYSRENEPSADGNCQVDNTIVGFEDKDYASYVITIENTGTNNITAPIVVFAKQGFDAEAWETVNTNRMESIKRNLGVFDIWFKKDSGSDIASVKISGGNPNEYYEKWFFDGEYWGFYYSENDDLARSSNVEKINESGKFDGIVEPGEKVSFSMSIPAELVGDDSMLVYFYDARTKLFSGISGSAGSLNNNDYLLKIDFDMARPSIKNVKMASFEPRNMFEGQALVTNRMAVDLTLTDSAYSCEDCIACSASNLETDSFNYFFISRESITGSAEWLYPELTEINRWAGAYFVPRAYSISLNLDLMEKGKEMLTKRAGGLEYRQALYISDNAEVSAEGLEELYSTGFSSQEDTSQIPLPETINPRLNSLTGPVHTFRADYGYTPSEDFTGYTVTVSKNGGEPTTHAIADNLAELVDVVNGDILRIEIFNESDEPAFRTKPSIIKTPYEPIFIDDYIGVNSSVPDYLNSNSFDFRIACEGAQTAYLYIQRMPSINPLADYAVIMDNGTHTITKFTDEEGLVSFSEYVPGVAIPETSFYLLSHRSGDSNPEQALMLTRARMQSEVVVNCISGCNESGGNTEFELYLGNELYSGNGLVVWEIIGEGEDSEFGNCHCPYDQYHICYCPFDCGLTDEQGIANCGGELFSGIASSRNFVFQITEKDGDEFNMSIPYLKFEDEEKYSLANPAYIMSEDYIGAFDGIVSVSTRDYDLKSVPYTFEITFPSSLECHQARMFIKTASAPYYRELTYETLTESPTAEGKCEYEVVSDLIGNDIWVFYGSFIEEDTYDLNWASIENVTNAKEEPIGLNFESEDIYIEYYFECEPGSGMCVREFRENSSDSAKEWANRGLLWEGNSIEFSEIISVEIYNGSLKKCANITYSINLNNDIYSKLVCIYRGVQGLFEEMEGSGLLELKNSVNLDGVARTSGSDPRFDINIGTSGSRSEKGLRSNYEAYINSDGSGMVIANNLGSDLFDFFLDTSAASSDKFMSDLFISTKEGNIHYDIPFPDSVLYDENAMSYDLDTVISKAMPVTYDILMNYYAERFKETNGSKGYYARRWIDSGLSQNCENSAREMMSGETCGEGDLSMPLTINRVGIHKMLFSTIEEGTSDSNWPEFYITNEMNHVAEPANFSRCSVVNGEALCVVEYDENGDELSIDTRGYVLSCMLYDFDENRHQEYSDINMSYYQPYVHPLKWEVDFDILVSPHTNYPIPMYVEETNNSYLKLSFSGDGVCQEYAGEGCRNAPEDCVCQTIESQTGSLPYCLYGEMFGKEWSPQGECGYGCVAGWGDCDTNEWNGCGTNLEYAHAVFAQEQDWEATPTEAGSCYCDSNKPEDETAIRESWESLSEAEKEGNRIAYHSYMDCTKSGSVWVGNLNIDGSDGCETDSYWDTQNCGACDNECLIDDGAGHYSTECVLGSCEYTCHENHENCDGNWLNGCEVDIGSDPNNCGECGYACPAIMGATASCTDGACTYLCDATHVDCDGNWENGCEITLDDTMEYSLDSGCSCIEGYADCDNDWTTGCEITLDDTMEYSAELGCYCASDAFADCDGNWENGCENINTDRMNCGSCGHVCAEEVPPKVGCTAGQCTQCDIDSDCDSYATLVCEGDKIYSLRYGCQNNVCVETRRTEVYLCEFGCNSQGTDCKSGYICDEKTCYSGICDPDCTVPEKYVTDPSQCTCEYKRYYSLWCRWDTCVSTATETDGKTPIGYIPDLD